MNDAIASAPPLVSVIVPVWNGAEQIPLCLAALQAQTYPKDRLEIIVVDNASTDATAEVVQGFAGVTLLHEPVAGSYHARNRALGQARGDYVAFTDADCIPAPDWLEKAIGHARARPDAGVIAGRIELFRPEPKADELYECYERLYSFRQDIGARKGFCATANWIGRRDDLLAFGGFQADRKSGADGELAHRFHVSGRPIVYAADAVVRHPVRGSFDDLAKKRRRLTGGRWDRTPGRGRALRILGVILWDTARRLKAAAIDGQLPLRMRARIASLVVALACVSLWELARLAGKGQASRA
jgi:glycosyltransferase involved in cell wall biosynthesis